MLTSKFLNNYPFSPFTDSVSAFDQRTHESCGWAFGAVGEVNSSGRVQSPSPDSSDGYVLARTGDKREFRWVGSRQARRSA